MLKRVLPAVLLATLTQSVSAEEFRLQYASFHDHIDKMTNEDYSQLEMRFSFIDKDKKLCPIAKAEIRAKDYLEQPIPLPSGEFLQLPNDKALDIEKAIVALDLPSVHCEIKIQVSGKSVGIKQYQTKDLAVVEQQLGTFMDDRGGMFSFLMPRQVEGLVLHLDTEQSVSGTLDGKPLKTKQSRVYIDTEQLADGTKVVLSHKTKLITPWMK